MVEKLYEYEGFLGRLHRYRDSVKEGWQNYRSEGSFSIFGGCKNLFSSEGSNRQQEAVQEDYSHVYRRKTRNELVRISAAVTGIEFSYAAETAFVSPTLLKIGVEHKHMTLVWALSPLIGFFVTPVLGSLSDRCPLKIGRRRPFIVAMSIGVLLGLILVPNGEDLGYALGDEKPPSNLTAYSVSPHRTSTSESPDLPVYKNSHPWGIFFTILGTVLLDFDADACQSPARAYLLDITVSDDHARGLSTFTVMAGLGGFFGYALGGINWDVTRIGVMLGGHVRAVFTLITIIFVICVSYTVTSFKEIPLNLLEISDSMHAELDVLQSGKPDANGSGEFQPQNTYGTLEGQVSMSKRKSKFMSCVYFSINLKFQDENSHNDMPTTSSRRSSARRMSLAPPADASLLLYLKSIVYMPASLGILCLTNLFCWMSHVCYSLYFTDFVGEAVFKGDPIALVGTEARNLYEEGVRFGCWGMSMYSLSCACYSFIIEKLILRYGAKRIYIGGLLVYAIGMFLMAITKHKIGVVLFSWTAGVMYSTLFTMPYLLVAHYHSKGVFAVSKDGEEKVCAQVRGLGTDVAIVSSMVFLAQFILSMCMGTIVNVTGTTTAVVSVASALSFFGALSATQVMYLDL
ncbi:sugar transporter [Holotrichia oblita]|uniref:Sugar transporter n=1 Tax=Holotrichia oblita TaxID=644536 RepID=A0ACB9SWS0_HOLOL|nr:sugar transporter [Holotrichia oblita]